MWQKKLAIFFIIMAVISSLCGILIIEVFGISNVGTVAVAVIIGISMMDLTIALFLFGRYFELKNNKISIAFNVIAGFVGVVAAISTIIDLVGWRL